MVFSSLTFLFVFFPIVSLLYFISCKKVKNIILLLASLLFYSWGEPIYIFLMLFSILLNYLFGIIIEKTKSKTKLRRIIFVISIICNVGLLFYFKYFNFFINNINNIFNSNIVVKDIVLPIGISFYTFQILSYIIDLYKNKIEVQKNIINLSLYISFFPQLIAGPIVQYKTIEEEINNRSSSIEDISSGLRRFIVGLSKKVLISNCLALAVDYLFDDNLTYLNTYTAWLAAISYTLQIYYDFSGYSDMAIGLGRIFGFHFNENFNYPYVSKTITEFWRRWHISLSTWFRDYIYIPLGGNRKGKVRTYINLLIVFFVTGLWHGASWNFILWGLYYGFFLIIEKLFLKKYLEKAKILCHFYTLLIVVIGWVLFRVENLDMVLNIYRMMFSFDFHDIHLYNQFIFNYQLLFVLIMSVILCKPCSQLINKLNNKPAIILKNCICIILFILCIIELSASGYNPFIYFRF